MQPNPKDGWTEWCSGRTSCCIQYEKDHTVRPWLLKLIENLVTRGSRPLPFLPPPVDRRTWRPRRSARIPAAAQTRQAPL
ncbi:hypothetical protein CRG98_032671 [Punica granatum]|uniref:Uncharacterized protein n=1 Tax=Punica granatum TaxID=22663 RepID=A0A2I0ISK3_PUNGR|nr:hypothetical protein CRG98_032671 [Punica granatum]